MGQVCEGVKDVLARLGVLLLDEPRDGLLEAGGQAVDLRLVGAFSPVVVLAVVLAVFHEVPEGLVEEGLGVESGVDGPKGS